MTHSTWTLDRFRRAGRCHLRSAKHILEKAKVRASGEPAGLPGSAAYLAHLALECVLKAHLLYRGACASAEVLEKKHPQVHRALFGGKEGHDLRRLAAHIRIEATWKLAGSKWKDDATWKRMAAAGRPYSLRYGAEEISARDAEDELDRASAMLAMLVPGIASAPLAGRDRRTRS